MKWFMVLLESKYLLRIGTTTPTPIVVPYGTNTAMSYV